MPQLDRKTVHVTLQAGVAEGTDPLSLQSGQLLQAENVRWRKDGAAEKRKGHSLVMTQKWAGGALTNLNQGEGRLVANDDELLVLDGSDVVSYSPAHAAVLTGGLNVCPAPRWSVFTTPLVSPPTTVVSQAQAIYATGSVRYAVLATVAQATYFSSVGGSATVAVFDADTGAPVGTTGLTSGSLNAATDIFCVHAFVVGSLVVVSYARSSTGSIYARTLNMATLAWSAEQTLTTDNGSYGGLSLMYDCKPIQGSASFYALAFARASTNAVAVLRINVSNGTTDTTLNLTHTTATTTFPPTGIGISSTSGGYTYVTYGWDADDTNGVGLYLSRATSSWLLDAGFPVTVALLNGSAALSGASGAFCYASGSACASSTTVPTVAYTLAFFQPGVSGAVTPWSVVWATYSTVVNGTTPGTLNGTSWMRLLSAPFAKEGRVSAVVQRDTGEWFGETFANVDGDNQYGAYNGLQQATCCVVDFANPTSTEALPLETCALFPAQLAVTDGASSFRPVTQYVDTTQLSFAISSWANAQERKRVHLCQLSRSDKYRWQPAKADDGIYLSGGLVCTYDRASVYPVGFTTDPVWCRVGEYATAGGSGWNAGTVGPVTDSINTTKYYFSVVWERVDKYGRVSRSSPDFGVVKGAGASSAVRLYGTAFSTATNASSILRVFYPGPVDWWDTYTSMGRNRTALYGYRDDSTALKRHSSAVRRAVTADITGYHFTELTSPPTFPEAAPTIYTAGAPLGALPHVQPPCLIGLVNYRNRLVGIDHTRRQLWFSKLMVQGEVAAFTLDFTIPIPFDGEALGVLDDKLVVFGTDRIGVLEGSGPDDRGLGQPFSDVVLVCTDRGCVEPRSVVQTPLGLMYQAGNGLMLMDRSGNQQFIGRPVQSTLESYPTVTSAVVHPTENVVLFSCISGNNGVRLVYDYRLNRWSVDRVQEGEYAEGEGIALLSQCVCNGRLYALTWNGKVIVEDTASYIDLNSWIYMRVKFAAERLGGLQGYQRIWKVALIGERYTDLDITVSLYGDDRAVADQTRVYEHATTSLTAPLRAEMRVKRQLSRALSVQVVDGGPTGGTVGTGRGFSLSGVSLECGVESDLTRTAPNRRT